MFRNRQRWAPLIALSALLVSAVAMHAQDPDGDPLPAGAIARMGSARLRQAGLIGPYYTMDGTVAFMPDGKTLFSAGSWSFRFWDTETGRKVGGIDLEKDELPQRSTLAAHALAPGTARHWP
jgi:sugar lactone lactonase YvrE